MAYGVFHSYYTGDTIILGKTCRTVIQKGLVDTPASTMGLHVYDLTTLYLYNNSDTVFMYNYLFKRFTPLYVFNVNPGDTIRLPILPYDYCNYPTITTTDSTFKIVVDSVKMVLYDTANLKTIYSHSIGSRTSDYVYDYANSFGDTVEGVYAEKIGSISIGFLPMYLSSAVNLLDESCEGPGALRCYNDNTLSVKLTTGLCSIPPTSIVPVNKTKAINIFPTPASDEINIQCSPTQKNMSVSIIDMNGKEVLSSASNYNNAVLNVAQLPQGIYLLKIFIDNDAPVYKRISIVH